MELGNEAKDHDARDPQEAQDDGDAVQVALGNTGRTKGGGHTAAEHVGDAAAATLVQQDEKRQQKAGNTQQYLHDDLENLHRKTFHTFIVHSTNTVEVRLVTISD